MSALNLADRSSSAIETGRFGDKPLAMLSVASTEP